MKEIKDALSRGADRVGGWSNHFRRTKRWEERAVHALTNLPATEFNTALDYALAYFIWSHSLREWLIGDGIFLKDELDLALRRYPEWRIVRDLANRSKHLILTQNPTDGDWVVFREYDHFAPQVEGRERHHLNLYFDGKKYLLLDVISSTRSMWEKILSDKGLI
ncbi:conserved hypothetical protein [Bosea sp. 62]|nr:conserved hypothetical protein [Bosea sp. 7B]CAD5277249.1 conserved hypothetical protein [Bosea sp. 21B]CAD5278337.1 conserved hypothetical protein [Bosea sp. 46]VVT59788.1 conserved hypothetical protein [Bosea sp. EC-HK365B]VXB43486.1 conserved hypothetical protein [Bosea sp. 62]VXC05127.1 conserved hypothetical protein [Bosea sp. 127]VXC25563.1 conserved hypothetical protein [Bosea sp. 29B]VXC76727.1 conserved hypothetical protein [Bosea sp. 125]